MKTKQFLSSGKPKSNEDEIGLMIRCLKCGNGRVFLITANLKNLYKERNTDKFRIETECENCKRQIEVVVGWVTKKDGFSYKEFRETEEFSVQDNDILNINSSHTPNIERVTENHQIYMEAKYGTKIEVF